MEMIDGASSFRAWLFVIARNHTKALRRANPSAIPASVSVDQALEGGP
jgi:DNA-directed RNA polymerase specialized sigma24 family protein